MGLFSKVVTFGKLILDPLVPKAYIMAIKIDMMHVLSLIYSVIITKQVCKEKKNEVWLRPMTKP